MTARVMAAITNARVHGVVPASLLWVLGGACACVCGFGAMILVAASVHSPWTVTLGALLFWATGVGYGYAFARR